MTEASGGSQSRPPRRRRPATKPATTSGSTGSSEPTPASPAGSDGPLGLERDEWTPPEQPAPADADVDLDDFEPPPREPLEWTPERAASIVRVGGYVLHTADALGREPEGVELWKATEADIEAIAPPLARILNRYEPARRLAGLSDEGELAFGVIAYTRRNLADRGRVIAAQRKRQQAAEQAAGGGEMFQTGPPESPPPVA